MRDIRRHNRSCRFLREDVHRNDCNSNGRGNHIPLGDVHREEDSVRLDDRNSNGRGSHIPLGDVHREEDCVRLDDRNSNGRGSHIPLGERTMQRYFRSDEGDNADP